MSAPRPRGGIARTALASKDARAAEVMRALSGRTALSAGGLDHGLARPLRAFFLFFRETNACRA